MSPCISLTSQLLKKHKLQKFTHLGILHNLIFSNLIGDSIICFKNLSIKFSPTCFTGSEISKNKIILIIQLQRGVICQILHLILTPNQNSAVTNIFIYFIFVDRIYIKNYSRFYAKQSVTSHHSIANE